MLRRQGLCLGPDVHLTNSFPNAILIFQTSTFDLAHLAEGSGRFDFREPLQASFLTILLEVAQSKRS